MFGSSPQRADSPRGADRIVAIRAVALRMPPTEFVGL